MAEGFFPMTEDSASAFTPPEDKSEGQGAAIPKKKFLDKFDSAEALEQGYRDVERFSHMTAQENADLKKQREADRLLLQQLATRQTPEKVDPEDEELITTAATTLGVTPERFLKMLDARAAKMSEPARKAAEEAKSNALAARFGAMWAEAKAEDKEIGKHRPEIDEYMKNNQGVFSSPNPFTKAWQEMQVPVTEADRQAEIEKIRAEAFEEGRKAAASRNGARMAPKGGGIAKSKEELTPLQQKSMAIFGTSEVSRDKGFFPKIIE